MCHILTSPPSIITVLLCLGLFFHTHSASSFLSLSLSLSPQRNRRNDSSFRYAVHNRGSSPMREVEEEMSTRWNGGDEVSREGKNSCANEVFGRERGERKREREREREMAGRKQRILKYQPVTSLSLSPSSCSSLFLSSVSSHFSLSLSLSPPLVLCRSSSWVVFQSTLSLFHLFFFPLSLDSVSTSLLRSLSLPHQHTPTNTTHIYI